MDERVRFVARLLGGEKMAVMCREFDISRKTGYKIFQRYKDFGLDGLTDRSRRPYRQANQLPIQIEKLIVRLKREQPSWGAPKIREKLRRLHDDVQTPAISTVHAVLYRHGLVSRGRRHRRHKAQGTSLSTPAAAQRSVVRRLQGRVHARRPPLLLPAHHQRLRHAAISSAARPWRPPRKPTPSPCSSAYSRSSAYPRRSAPTTACPSPAPHALFGLSKLAVWWLRLGIDIERIKPGHPDAERPPRAHSPDLEEGSHQAGRPKPPAAAGRFDDFLDCYNQERPHQALDMKYPAELYRPSPRPYRGLGELDLSVP